MKTALELCDTAAQHLAALDPTTLDRDDLGAGALRLQAHIDRLKGLHAIVVAEADRQRLWADGGYRNVSEWLAAGTNTHSGEVKARAKLGAAMGKSSKLRDAVTKGDVSAASAEKAADAVNNPPAGTDADDVDELVDAIVGTGPDEARDVVERWTQIHRDESDAEATARRHQLRSVRFGKTVDGIAETIVRLPEREHAEFRATLTAIAGKPCQLDDRTTEQRLADGLIQLCAAYAKGDLTGGREGANILLTMTPATLAGIDDEPAHTATGDTIPATIARQIAENAAIQRVVHTGERILNLGRSVRFATADHYKALVVRDGGCRWPGCRIPAAWCDIDHLTPWELGGTTDLSNLIMWCRHHHTRKHQPGTQVHGTVDALWLTLPNGTTLHCPLPTPRTRTRAAA
jgi:hypothetical protein